MFKKYYKEANDDIKPNRDLIDKIFEEAGKQPVKKPFSKVYKFGMAVAAVLVLAVSVGFFARFENEPMENNKLQLAVEKKNPKTSVETEKKKDEKNVEVQPETKDVQQSEVKESVPERQKEVEPEPTVDGEKTERTETVVIPIVPENEAPPAVVAEEPVLAMANEDEQSAAFSGRMAMEPLEETKDGEAKEASLGNLTEVGEAEASVINSMLASAFGEVDEETGNPYSFVIRGKTEDVYVGSWSWIVENHSSQLTEFVITADMSAMYECNHTEDGRIRWTTEDNLLVD